MVCLIAVCCSLRFLQFVADLDTFGTHFGEQVEQQLKLIEASFVAMSKLTVVAPGGGSFFPTFEVPTATF